MLTRVLFLGAMVFGLIIVGATQADVVTKYSFENNLLDTGPASTVADTLSAVAVGGPGAESYEAGLVGQAVRLDVATGTAFVLNAPTSNDLNLAADWTLEAFVKPDLQNSTEWDRFWTKWGEGSNDWHWAFRRDNNGLDYFMNGSQVFDASTGAPDNSVPLNEWSHVAVVGNSGAGTIAGYLNGNEVVSGAYSAPVPGASNMNFGNFGTGAPNDLQFTGLIDEAMIHNMAVDASYLAGRTALIPEPTTGLLAVLAAAAFLAVRRRR